MAFNDNNNFKKYEISKPAFICLKPTFEVAEQCVKPVQN